MKSDAGSAAKTGGMGLNDGLAGSIGTSCVSSSGDPIPPCSPNYGSQQLRLFRRARAAGASTEEAAEIAGISIGEARLHAAEDDANPPPPEALVLLFDPDAKVAASQPKEDDMAGRRKAREPKEQVEEVKTKDFERSVRVYRNDIKPAKSQAASEMQKAGEGYKLIAKECHIQRPAAQAAFSIFEKEEAMRDDYLRGFVGTFNELMGYEALTYQTNDLVDMAQRGGLATLSDDDDDDDDDFDEADEEELAAQEGRPAPGTGAAARAAMNESRAAEVSASTH